MSIRPLARRIGQELVRYALVLVVITAILAAFRLGWIFTEPLGDPAPQVIDTCAT